MAAENISVRCCIAGGGPAGMMLGLLLARAGVDVLVLEKHADFFRDFRGDTIHPSTLEIFRELEILDDFLQLPHQEAREFNAQFGDTTVAVADFSHLPTRCQFVAFMPQWDFLNFVAKQGARYPAFALRMQTEVSGLIEEDGKVAGVRATTPDGTLEVRANLVIGADGRSSVVREKAGLEIDELGAPMDAMWFRLPRRPSDPEEPVAHLEAGHIFIMINRGQYWQCAYVIPKGTADSLRAEGIGAFRANVATLAPFAGDNLREPSDWNQISLLSVRVDRLRQWYRPGVLCIGDAAHAMSPVGGVGINLAIQDAVAASNLLAQPLRENTLTTDHLRQVQRRRELPTRLTQWFQLQVQRRVIARVLSSGDKFAPPRLVRLFDRFRWLRRIPARMIGIGFRPEHVKTSATVWKTAS